MSDHAKIQNAQRAKELLTELSPFIEAVRQELFTELTNTDDADVPARERVFLELRAVDRVRQRIVATINSGKIAEHALKSVATGRTQG